MRLKALFALPVLGLYGCVTDSALELPSAGEQASLSQASYATASSSRSTKGGGLEYSYGSRYLGNQTTGIGASLHW